MSVEPNDTFTLVAFPVSILSSDGAFCWSRSSVAPSHRVCAPSEVPKTLRRAAWIKTSESFGGFLKCQGEGKLAVANMSGEQWERRHHSKSAAHDRPLTRHIKRKRGSEQTCDAGRTLRLGPTFLSNCPGKRPGIDRADLEFSMSGNDCGIQIARRNHKTETGV